MLPVSCVTVGEDRGADEGEGFICTDGRQFGHYRQLLGTTARLGHSR